MAVDIPRVKVFIGSEKKTEIARKVLECSIFRRTDADVTFTTMIGPEWEYDHSAFRVGTGFSLRRWMIPAACGFRGRAIYLDADQLVFGDIHELWKYADRQPEKSGVWCTHQPDKSSPKLPVPQSSVMLIDCEAVAGSAQFDLGRILEALRLDKTRKTYDDVMHLRWLDGHAGVLPTTWNRLNTYVENDTKLLHYTKEPEQPWYKPDHPHARVWRIELQTALNCGHVGREEFVEALANWNVKEDWRTTNGLHPSYAPLTPTGPRAPKPRASPKEKPVRPTVPSDARSAGVADRKVLWVTSCASDMWRASGANLVASFQTHSPVGLLYVGLEDHERPPRGACVEYFDAGNDPWTKEFLKKNKDIIPASLGGDVESPECRCVGGPFPPHSKQHKMPCVGHWFNKNMSRWFRKIAAQRRALSYATTEGYDTIIWLDSDCEFLRDVGLKAIDGWFNKVAACFYLRNSRPVLESGVMGFDLARGGDSLITAACRRYESGEFRTAERWEDSTVHQWCIENSDLKCVDIAVAVGEHAAVVPHSPLGMYLVHKKGAHSRIFNIMT